MACGFSTKLTTQRARELCLLHAAELGHAEAARRVWHSSHTGTPMEYEVLVRPSSSGRWGKSKMVRCRLIEETYGSTD
jgi:hypothetical protein